MEVWVSQGSRYEIVEAIQIDETEIQKGNYEEYWIDWTGYSVI